MYLVNFGMPIFNYNQNPPIATTPSLEGIWPAYESCVDKGMTKHIGVSNAPCAVVANLIANS